MLFTSIEFYIFLSVTFAFWRMTPPAWRNRVLLVASYLFCAWWQPWFALVLLYSTLVSYIGGIRMADVRCPMSDVGYQGTDVGCRMSDVGYQGTDVGCRMSDVRYQKKNREISSALSDLGPRTSDIGSPSDQGHPTSDIESLSDRGSRTSDLGSLSDLGPLTSDIRPFSDIGPLTSDIGSPSDLRPLTSDIGSPSDLGPLTSDIGSPSDIGPLTSDIGSPSDIGPLTSDIRPFSDLRHRTSDIWLSIAVALNLLPLFFFKYFNFFNDSLRNLFTWGGIAYGIPALKLLLPVGISFYTFQAVSYCADVYSRRIEPERNLATFALYLSFFPKLISGPIERGKNLLPQLRSGKRFDTVLFVSGVQLFFWGVFKKIVIADRLGMYVDMVFSDPAGMYGKTAILGAWMFSLQIYCDFSAYMDMAIGCGRIFGIELSRNFNFPYMARSIGEFWRCWHITLTSWFRDYVYIPLGGNRVNARRWAANILIVFIVSGLWHGAAWTFVFWGGLHGLFYLIEKYTATIRSTLRRFLRLTGRCEAVWQILITFNLVSLAWVFFRARSIDDAFVLIGNMFVHFDWPVRMLASQFSTALAFFFAILFIFMELIHYWVYRRSINLVSSIPPVLRYPGYALGLIATCLLGVSSSQFIYFQF